MALRAAARSRMTVVTAPLHSTRVVISPSLQLQLVRLVDSLIEEPEIVSPRVRLDG
jgi:hypothetical protein